MVLIFYVGCYEQGSSPDDISNNLNFSSGSLSNGMTEEDLAYHWAPIHYQDLYAVNGDESRTDYITRIDRGKDGNEGAEWNLSNNWDKDLKYKLRAYVYYSIVESETHYYVTYSFFHPWDTAIKPKIKVKFDRFKDGNLPVNKLFDKKVAAALTAIGFPSLIALSLPFADFDFGSERTGWEHNDMEGVLFVVKKNGSYGDLEAVFTQAHGYLQVYLTEFGKQQMDAIAERKRPFIIAPQSDTFAKASMGDDVNRIITTQEAQGHGAGCWPDWGSPSPGNLLDAFTIDKRHRNGSLLEKMIERPSGNDHIRYIPTRGEPEEPNYSEIKDQGMTYCKYKLINSFGSDGIWTHRKENEIFLDDNKFKGDHGNAFWAWDGDKEGFSAESATEEAELFLNNGWHKFKNAIRNNVHVESICQNIKDALWNFFKDKINIAKKGYEKAKECAQKAWDKVLKIDDAVKSLGDKAAGLGEKLGKAKSGLSSLGKKIKDIDVSISGVKDGLKNTKNALKKTPQTVKKKFRSWIKKLIGGHWGWKTKSVSNPKYARLQSEISKLEKKKSSLSTERASLISQKTEKEKTVAGIQKQIAAVQSDLDLKRKERESARSEYSIQQSVVDVFFDEISNLKKVWDMVKDADIDKDEVSGLVADLAEEKVIDMLVVDKDIVFPVIDEFYRPLSLSDEEKYFITQDHRPWSHNPAHLCWVYLKPKEGRKHFSEYYLKNDFMEEIFAKANFKYENGRSIRK